MKSSDIMAVVVSFNGEEKTVQTIRALVNQVGHVHVVDNCSDANSIGLLKKIEQESNISISWLKENKGIGAALNIGVGVAKNSGFKWLLTMDQDSLASEGMVDTFVDEITNNTTISCLGANYRVQAIDNITKLHQVSFLITSGNLIRLDIFDKIGLYNEDFFIDCVDFDFSLRVRKAGLDLFVANAAHMAHELGDKDCTLPVLGRFHTYHSPLRRYYMYRNFFYLLKEHALEFPVFMIKSFIAHLLYLMTIILFGEERIKSLIYIYYGTVGFFRGEKGAWKKRD